MTCWYYFSQIVGTAGNSLSSMQDIIKKFYFPRLILPLSKMLVGMTDYIVSFILLLILMILLGYFPAYTIVLFPFALILNIIVGMSIAVWLSALTIRYRDIHHVIHYVLGFGIWLTPVFYAKSLIPKGYDHFLYLNPMAAVIELFRWSVLGTTFPSMYYLISIIPVFILLITGLLYFIKVENRIADII